jgi:hypothetical protein
MVARDWMAIWYFAVKVCIYSGLPSPEIKTAIMCLMQFAVIYTNFAVMGYKPLHCVTWRYIVIWYFAVKVCIYSGLPSPEIKTAIMCLMQFTVHEFCCNGLQGVTLRCMTLHGHLVFCCQGLYILRFAQS